MNNLSERDKKLLALLAVLILGYVLYTFVFNPQFNTLNDLRSQNDQLQSQLISMDSKIATLDNLKKQVQTEKQNIMPLAQRHFHDVNQEDLISLINDLNYKSGLDFKQISFEESGDLGFDFTGNQWNNLAQDPNANQPQQPPSEQTTQDAGQPAGGTSFNPSDNISLTGATVNFEGTYDELIKLFDLMKENPQNIVSNRIKLSKQESSENAIKFGKNSDDYVSGDILLHFFKIKSLDVYLPEPISIFESKIIPTTAKSSPFMSYSWINQDNPSSQVLQTPQSFANTIINSGYAPINHPSGVAVLPAAAISYKKPVELTRFDSITGFKALPSSDLVTSSISLKNAEGKNYKIVSLDNVFPKDNAQSAEVLLDMSEKGIVLSKKPDTLQLSVYQIAPTGVKMEYVFEDANKNLKRINIIDEANFSGFKEFETDLGSLAYPATLKGIAIANSTNKYPNENSILFDSLYANYTISK